MPTPTEWLNEFQVNTEIANIPTVADPHIVGLSNGNILVAWAEAGTNGIGTTAVGDIIGKIFDGAGNLVRDSYRINTTRNADDERDFDISATDDGGFNLTYIDRDGTSSRVVWERKNASGNTIDSDDLISETGNENYSNPEISSYVRGGDVDLAITFQNFDGGGFLNPADTDISLFDTYFGPIFRGPKEGASGGNNDSQVQNQVVWSSSGDVLSVYRDSADNEVRLDLIDNFFFLNPHWQHH